MEKKSLYKINSLFCSIRRLYKPVGLKINEILCRYWNSDSEVLHCHYSWSNKPLYNKIECMLSSKQNCRYNICHYRLIWIQILHFFSSLIHVTNLKYFNNSKYLFNIHYQLLYFQYKIIKFHEKNVKCISQPQIVITHSYSHILFLK